MPYQISQTRNTNIRNRLSNEGGLHDHLNGLIDLLKINTKQPNDAFLVQFRQLKEQHPIINDLCRPSTGGLLWRKGISYFFKSDTKKTERYKTIINQLKTGLSPDQISYFGNNLQNQKSVCTKVHELKNDLYKQINPSDEEKLTFEYLTTFNNNLEFNPPVKVMPNIQNFQNTDLEIWNKFIETKPQYAILNSKNESADNIKNIEGKSCNELRRELYSELKLNEHQRTIFNENGTLHSDVGNKIKQQQQQQSATKIQAHVRGFQQRLKAKKQNEYGIREIKTNKNGEDNQIFIFSENLVVHSVPKLNVSSKNAAKGQFKTVIAKDDGNILFSKNKLPSTYRPPKSPYTSNEVEKILITHGIKSYKPTIQISPNQYIAHNAGEYDLKTSIRHGDIYPPQKFKQILNDTKTLHQKRFYHLDLKGENIQVNDKKELSVIDLDTFSSIGCLVTYAGTPLYANSHLFHQNFGSMNGKGNPTIYSLQTSDEFALALTIMEASGVTIPKNNLKMENKIVMRDGNMTITSEMTEFISQHIRPDYQKTFTDLLQNPYEYSKTNPQTNLADMFNLD